MTDEMRFAGAVICFGYRIGKIEVNGILHNGLENGIIR